MNLFKSKVFVFILHTIFILAFFIHITIIFVNILNPDLPEVQISQMDLKDIEFPLTFRICIHDHDVNKIYKDAGYQNVYTFFKGRSLYNKTIYGFLGHLQNGSTKYDSFVGSSSIINV